MILINDRFSIERDSKTWKLHETTPNKPGSKNETSTRTTYPANMQQVFQSIIDKSGDDTHNLESIIELIRKSRNEIIEAVKANRIEK